MQKRTTLVFSGELSERIATRILLYLYHTEGEYRLELLEPLSGIVAEYLRPPLTTGAAVRRWSTRRSAHLLAIVVIALFRLLLLACGGIEDVVPGLLRGIP